MFFTYTFLTFIISSISIIIITTTIIIIIIFFLSPSPLRCNFLPYNNSFSQDVFLFRLLTIPQSRAGMYSTILVLNHAYLAQPSSSPSLCTRLFLIPLILFIPTLPNLCSLIPPLPPSALLILFLPPSSLSPP